MNKNISKTRNIKNKKDVKKFFQKLMDDKAAWIDCVCNGRSVTELEARGMKVAKLSDVLA